MIVDKDPSNSVAVLPPVKLTTAQQQQQQLHTHVHAFRNPPIPPLIISSRQGSRPLPNTSRDVVHRLHRREAQRVRVLLSRRFGIDTNHVLCARRPHEAPVRSTR